MKAFVLLVSFAFMFIILQQAAYAQIPQNNNSDETFSVAITTVTGKTTIPTDSGAYTSRINFIKTV